MQALLIFNELNLYSSYECLYSISIQRKKESDFRHKANQISMSKKRQIRVSKKRQIRVSKKRQMHKKETFVFQKRYIYVSK